MIVLWIFRKGFCVKETLCKYKRKSQVVFQKRQKKGVNFRLIQKSVRIGSLETKIVFNHCVVTYQGLIRIFTSLSFYGLKFCHCLG